MDDKKIKVVLWITVVGILQFSVEKLLFQDPPKPKYTEIELYKPRAELEYRLSSLLRHINDSNYYQNLSIETGGKTLDYNYVNTLIKYHGEILQLYEMSRSKEMLLSFEAMGKELIRILDFNGNDSCLSGQAYGDFKSTAGETALIMKKLVDKETNIRDFDQRFLSVKPDRDENGGFNTEAATEKLLLIKELMSNPYLFIRMKEVDPFNDFRVYMDHFDVMHNAYQSCAESYSKKVKDRSEMKLIIQFLLFFSLTLGLYRKELL